MIRLHANKLLQASNEELRARLKGRFTLVFEDGELDTSAHATIISSSLWEFHRRYPNTPLSIRHHVDDVLGGERYSVRTHLKMMERIRWAVYDTYQHDLSFEPTVLEQFCNDLDHFMYNTSGYLYNTAIQLTGRHVNSLDLLDMIEVQDFPAIREAIDTAEPTEESIAHMYKVVEHSLMKDPGLAHNQLAKIARSRLANMSQIQQIIAWRGFATDLSRYRFPKPIMTSYLDGMHTYYDSGVESRQASVALGNSKSPLEQSEYQNRRFQLVAEYVKRLHVGDCGSTEYHYFTVLGEQRDGNGALIAKSDLNYIVGKNYLDDDGTLRMIKESDTHLLGRTIRMRSPGHCRHRDTYGVCSTCFGGLSDNILRSDNLGHLCSAYIGQKISQELLSTKHLLVSVLISLLMLTEDQLGFLGLGPDKMTYTLADKLRGKEVSLVIDAAFAANLADLQLVNDVNILMDSDISELRWIGFLVDEEFHKISLGQDGRYPSLSHALLSHIKTHRIEIDEHRRYIIPMKDYNWREPIMTVPRRSYDTSDFAGKIRSIVESTKQDLKKNKNQRNFDNILNVLYRHVNTRMSVNIVNLEILLYAFTIRSREANDYAMSKTYTDAALGVKTEVFNHRSVSAVMVFEKQKDVLHNAWNYVHPNVMDHLFDALFLPEVLFPVSRATSHRSSNP